MKICAVIHKIQNSTAMVVLLAIAVACNFAGVVSADALYQSGWPQNVQGVVHQAITSADVDKDGKLEVIAISKVDYHNSRIYVWDEQGVLLNGWPKDMSRISGSPCVGDLDGDGFLEIVVATFFEAKVYAFDHTGTLLAGWPQQTSGPLIFNASPAFGDLEGDGDLEILIVTSFGGIYAWHHDGILLDDWPIVAGGFTYSPPSLADIDQDGDLELFISARYGLDSWVRAYHHNDIDGDGQIDAIETWNPPEDGGTGDVLLGDIDTDGQLELVVAIRGYVYAWELSGEVMNGWPQQTPGFVGLALGDLDADGNMEIVAASTNDNLYIWHHDGTVFEQWPENYYELYPEGQIGSFPIIADVDGDNQVDLLTNHATGIYAYRLDGSSIPGWPLLARISAVPMLLADIDADNDLEVLAGGSNKMYVWDVAGEYDAAFIEWNGYQHDRYNSGYYGHRIGLNVSQNGYAQIQLAIDAAQAGDFVSADPFMFQAPVSGNIKSGIDVIWKKSIRRQRGQTSKIENNN